MSPEERLAEIIAALESVGLAYLVMGGHAVRYYGLMRNTIDFDLHLAPDRWNELPELLSRTRLAISGEIAEGNSWRPHAFRRFQIGRLADGREEWLEFWRENHLLPGFSELYERREIGTYGGQLVSFLALPDLIRSKETERVFDWQDVEQLEEFLDARCLAQLKKQQISAPRALALLRSKSGLERYLAAGQLEDAEVVAEALSSTKHPVTQAILLPFSPTSSLSKTEIEIEPLIVDRLKAVAPTSVLHFTLVEAVRRQYRQFRQMQDRLDKEEVRKAQEKPLS